MICWKSLWNTSVSKKLCPKRVGGVTTGRKLTISFVIQILQAYQMTMSLGKLCAYQCRYHGLPCSFGTCEWRTGPDMPRQCVGTGPPPFESIWQKYVLYKSFLAVRRRFEREGGGSCSQICRMVVWKTGSCTCVLSGAFHANFHSVKDLATS